MAWGYLVTWVAANLALLLPEASPLRVVGGLLLIGFLPGLSWTGRFLPSTTALLRWTAAAALSFALTSLAALLVHYLPGPVQSWQLLVVFNVVALLPILTKRSSPIAPISFSLPLRSLAPLFFILLIALLLRTVNLHYSEFQGDEALAMIVAAEVLEGYEDALLLRSKGPGELLLPLALWRLSGTTTEAIARLPFAMAALFSILTIYLIGCQLGGRRVGWLAAGFFAFNGFMVAFGRIVQYQVIVVWMSGMAFLLLIHWRRTGRRRFAFLSGLCLGAGLLAHYDAILIVPALGWLLLHPPRPGRTALSPDPPDSTQHAVSSLIRRLSSSFKPTLLLLAACLLVALPFYLPFLLNPQVHRTGAYVGDRIGNELRNNLPDFFHFNTFYSSSYYTIITGLLVLSLLVWLVWQADRKLRWVSILAGLAILAVTFKPDLLAGQRLDLSILPFTLLFAGAFIAPLIIRNRAETSRTNGGQTSPGYRPKTANKPQPPSAPPSILSLPAARSPSPIPHSPFPIPHSPFPIPHSLLPTARLQALILWVAIPFLGYNFVVALGLTHIYTIVPAWSLLAALGWYYFFGLLLTSSFFPRYSLAARFLSNTLLVGLAVLSSLFLGNAFLRHDIEYHQDYPDGNLSLFWNPYDRPPQAGFFGFPHRAGWKAVGQKIVTGELAGDYGSNEEPDVTTWYTRGAARACDSRPEFYFLADDLVDRVEVPTDLIATGYAQIGSVTLPNQKQMEIMQQRPAGPDLGELDERAMSRAFDRTATPAAFARSARGANPTQVNFSHQIELIGYDIDTRRAYPGGRVPVTLYWQALASIPRSYQVFTHLESETGPVAQADGVPVCWSYPTDLWRPGQIIADQHAILLPPDIAPGRYPLAVGLYRPDTLERFDVLDEAGNPAGTSFTLTEVIIDNE